MPPLLILLLILGFTAANVAATLYLIGVLKMANLTLAELGPRLATLADRVEKVKVEVQALKDLVTDPTRTDVPADVVAQLERVEAAVGGVDDINTDA